MVSHRMILLKLCPLLLAGLVLAGSCTSRYRLTLYLEIDSRRSKAEVEQSEFYTGARLGDPFSDKKIARGDKSVLVITTGSRGQTIKTSTGTVVDYDEHLRCKLYLQTDRAPAAGRTVLADNSFVHLLGRFEQSPQSKTFLPSSGFFVIDSIADGHLFGDIDGSYRNSEGQLLSFDGKFKVSISD